MEEKGPDIFDVLKRAVNEDVVSFGDIIRAIDGPEASTPEGCEAIDLLIQLNTSDKPPRHIP